MITKPRLVRLLIAGLCAALFPTVSLPSSLANECTSFKIAYQGPLTGPEASLGISQLNAIKFALNKFKSENIAPSLSAEIFTADDQGDPALGATAAQSIVNQPCVLGVVGPAYSGAAKIALPIFTGAGLLFEGKVYVFGMSATANF